MALDAEELRALVREALEEALPALKMKAAGAGGGSFIERLRAALGRPKPATVPIELAGEADLNAFARDLVQAAAHEEARAAVLGGHIRFTIAGAKGDLPAGGTRRIDKGVVTESMVIEIGKTHRKLVAAKGVVVTPLARDRAREAELEIVREPS